MRIDYPVATDNDYAAWLAFGNHYRPALYFADARGRIRHHHFGEGEYAESEMVIAAAAGRGRIDRRGHGTVSVDPSGLEVPADWASLNTRKLHRATSAPRASRPPAGPVPANLTS